MAGEEAKTKSKGGRPKKYIDKQLFEQLCGLQCTLEEMEAFFSCDHKTIARWCRETYEGKRFSQVFREKRQIGKISLRRKQLRLATTAQRKLLQLTTTALLSTSVLTQQLWTA
mgnify:CR=1 FL=1